MDRLAIVILNYNGAHHLKQFLPSFLENSGNHPIYVADNASSDNSIEVIKNEFPTIRLLQLDKNYGFTEGYNRALQQINTEYYAIVNSDIEVSSMWTEPLLTFLTDHPVFVACQPKIKSYQNKEYFEYAGACGGYIDSLGYPFCRGRIFNELEKDFGQYDSIATIFWASGACMMIRSSVFHELGGFDTHFFAHMEEIDLCWRAHHKGYKIGSVPQSVVYHVGGGTLNALNPRKTYLNFRNGLSILVKNLPLYAFWKLPVRIVLDWVAALKFLVEGNGNHCIAVIKAHFHWIFLLPRNLKNRPKQTLSIRGTQNKNVRSIVFERYVRFKKRYSAL